MHKLDIELLNLITSDYIETLHMKIPKKIYNREIHTSPPSKIHTDTLLSTKLRDKYADIINDIQNNIVNYDNNFKTNFKFLRQLDNIEEIYDLINNNQDSRALDVI